MGGKLMLRLDWDTETTPYIDNACYITVRTGRSRAYRNVLNGLGVRQPARAARIREDMDALLLKVSESGGNALSTPNVPEMVIVKFDSYEVVVVHGIVFTSVTAGGRLVGDFKLLIVMIDEMDAVLTDVFLIEKYVQAALSQ
jgi:hypothetical protein